MIDDLRAAMFDSAILDATIRKVVGRLLNGRDEDVAVNNVLGDTELHRRKLCALERERRSLALHVTASTHGLARAERKMLRRVLDAQRVAAFDLHATAGFHRELADLLQERPHTIDELAATLYGEDMRPARASLEILLHHMLRVKLARRLPDGRWAAAEERDAIR